MHSFDFGPWGEQLGNSFWVPWAPRMPRGDGARALRGPPCEFTGEIGGGLH